MDPFVGASLVSAGAGIIGNLFGKKSSDDANKTNLKINQMNNEFNERMLDKQLQYNTDMWNKQNAYNDPSSQVARLKAAGINPIMAMQGQGGGIAASALGASPPSSSPAAAQQAFRPDMSPFMQAADMLFQKRIREEELQGQKLDNESKRIDNETRHQENLARIDEAIERAKDSRQRRRLESARHLLESRQMTADYFSTVQQQHIAELNAQGIQLDNIYKSLQNENIDPLFKAQIAEKWANVGLMNANKKLTFKQVEHEAEKIVETTARANGIKLDNSLKKRIENSLVIEARARAYKSQMPQNKYEFGVQTVHSIFDVGNQLINSAVKASKRAWKDTRRSFGLYW